MTWTPSGPIVVPVDFSGEEVAAVSEALAIAGGDASRLRVIHVLPPLDNVSPGVVFGSVTDETRRTAVEEAFEKLGDVHGWAGVDFEVRLGDPGTIVAEYAKSTGAGLIVVPSHGYHGFRRFLLGSVAERILRAAECDVLVLRRSDAE